MTTYAMDTRGTQHVRPRPRVRGLETDRPQVAPVARPDRHRGAPQARPQLRGAADLHARTVTHSRVRDGVTVAGRHAVRSGAAALPAAGVRLTERGVAVVTGLFGLAMASGIATVVTQFVLISNP